MIRENPSWKAYKEKKESHDALNLLAKQLILGYNTIFGFSVVEFPKENGKVSAQYLLRFWDRFAVTVLLLPCWVRGSWNKNAWNLTSTELETLPINASIVVDSKVTAEKIEINLLLNLFTFEYSAII